MSILDGLVRRDWDGFPSEDGTVVVFDDAREALTNPTDEQVDAISRKVAADTGLTKPPWWIVRAVLAAAAGGDDE